MDNAAGAEGRREILEAVRDGGLSARAAAAALKATRSGASAQQGAVQGTAPVGWFSPQWRADSPAPVASGERAGVIVAGLDHRPEGLGAGRRVVDLPPPGGEAGESLGVMSWTRWWSEALGAVSTPDPGRRCLVVLDGGRLCGGRPSPAPLD